MLEIDASQGGQVMRTSLALATLLQKPITLKKIRSDRPNPGLQAQHLATANVIASICNTKLENAALQSTELVFKPNTVQNSNFTVKIGTAGSTMLLLQCILLPSLLKEIKLRVSGGTDAKYAPPVNYFRYVLFPILKKMNVKYDLNNIQHGYFPKGNGNINFKSYTLKNKIKSISLTESSPLKFIEIFSHSASLPTHVAREQSTSARKALEHLNVEILPNELSKESTNTIGSAIDIFAHFENGSVIGANALGAKGIPATEVGAEAAKNLLSELSSNAPVDSHLCDQLLPFMALAKGTSSIKCTKLTDHTLNNISTIEKFVDVKFKVKGEKDQSAEISVDGAAFSAAKL